MARKEDDNDVEREMHGGYRREMPERFTVFSLIALSFSLTGSWAALGSSIGISIKEASAAGTIFSPLIGATMTGILSIGMAELASAYPVASGQYYWAYAVSSKEYRILASYVNGWLNILAYWLAGASVCNFASSLILSIVLQWHPEYESKSWHQWLIYVGLVWLGVALNSIGAKILPKYVRFHFTLSWVTMTGTVITLLVCSRNHHAPPKWTFGDTTNRTGWSNDGFAFLLAVSNSVYSFLGTDCAVHMCEEMPQPARNVPKIILYPILFGLITAIPFTCACMNAITDIQAVLDSPSGLPLIEIYYQSTGSKAASSVLLALLVACFFGCWASNATTCSRIVWSIARDDVLPFSSTWAYIHPRTKVPLNALFLSGIVISLYGLIFLGSTTAFSAMVGAAVIFMQMSCALPQMILLYRGRDKILPPRPFSLGRFGTAVSAITTFWTLFITTIYFFPTERPVTKENMNYLVVVTAGFLTIIFALYFSKRGTLKGPGIQAEKRLETVEVHRVR